MNFLCDTQEEFNRRANITLAVIFLVIIFSTIYMGSYSRSEMANADIGVLEIRVPWSFGEPVAIAASQYGSSLSTIVTILFERGTTTFKMQIGESYRLVYFDAPTLLRADV